MNIGNVLELVKQKVPVSRKISPVSDQERELALKIVHLLLGYSDYSTTEILDFALDGLDDEYDDEDSITSDTSDDDCEDEIFEHNVAKKQRVEEKYSPEQWKKIIAMADRKWSLKTIQKSYRKITCWKDIERAREAMEKGGSHAHKLHLLDNKVFEQFSSWREECRAVHDSDLVDIGLKIANDLNISNFVASESWVYQFKKRHRIVSRKVTTFVTRSQIRTPKISPEILEDFRKKVKTGLKNYPHSKVYNTDHTGINQELTTGNSLEHQGVRKVHAFVQRINPTTHSYTIQPVISADGTLMLPVLVCFKEPNVPQKFHEQLKPFTKLIPFHHTSGKMTADLTDKWLKDHFLPRAGAKPLLILDSWTGFKKPLEKALHNNPESLEVLQIPAGTTSVLQPLDIFFNRQLKRFLKRLSDKIRLYHENFILSTRVGIAHLIHLTVSQFAAPCFKPMIKYAWYAGGYLSERPEGFLDPTQVCFNSIEIGSMCGCTNRAFIKCANCEKFLCFKHFVEDLHDCC